MARFPDALLGTDWHLRVGVAFLRTRARRPGRRSRVEPKCECRQRRETSGCRHTDLPAKCSWLFGTAVPGSIDRLASRKAAAPTSGIGFNGREILDRSSSWHL